MRRKRRRLEAELNSLAEELDVCVRKSEELKKEIPAELLRKYEQIKGAGRGVAVVVGLEGGLRRVSHVHSSPVVQ